MNHEYWHSEQLVDLLHDPTRVTDGIEASDDPILQARRGIYETSVAHHTGGWKGREAALEREAADRANPPPAEG